MAKKAGRKSAYDTKIKPYFARIAELCRTHTDEQIAKALGISYSTLNKYKAMKPEFREVLKNGRQDLCIELKGALIKKALGYEYTETKVTEDSKGNRRTITTTRYEPPDIGAIHLLLKNYDPEWTNDPKALELKKKELELHEQQIKNKEW